MTGQAVYKTAPQLAVCPRCEKFYIVGSVSCVNCGAAQTAPDAPVERSRTLTNDGTEEDQHPDSLARAWAEIEMLRRALRSVRKNIPEGASTAFEIIEAALPMPVELLVADRRNKTVESEHEDLVFAIRDEIAGKERLPAESKARAILALIAKRTKDVSPAMILAWGRGEHALADPDEAREDWQWMHAASALYPHGIEEKA